MPHAPRYRLLIRVSTQCGQFICQAGMPGDHVDEAALHVINKKLQWVIGIKRKATRLKPFKQPFDQCCVVDVFFCLAHLFHAVAPCPTALLIGGTIRVFGAGVR